MDVSKNSGTPKSSILIGFSIINHPFWGTPIFGNIHIHIYYIFTQPGTFATPETDPSRRFVQILLKGGLPPYILYTAPDLW